MGPNYANLFVGFVGKQIFEQYSDPTPEYFGRYIDDCIGTASCSRGELDNMANWNVNNFHPAPQFTWEISETSISFLDIIVSINGNRLCSVSYKPTDSHNYLLYSSSHPNHTKRAIPFSQFLRLAWPPMQMRTSIR